MKPKIVGALAAVPGAAAAPTDVVSVMANHMAGMGSMMSMMAGSMMSPGGASMPMDESGHDAHHPSPFPKESK